MNNTNDLKLSRMQLTCVECGTKFRPIRRNQLTCSKECRTVRVRRRALAQQQALRQGRQMANTACRALEAAVRPIAVATTMDELDDAYRNAVEDHVEALRQYRNVVQHRLLNERYHETGEDVEESLDELQFKFFALLAEVRGEAGAATP